MARRPPAPWRWALAAAMLALGPGPVTHAAEAPAGARVDNPAGLRWRETTQERRMPDSRTGARFVFAVENVSPDPVAILAIHVSCPCVSYKLPPLPGGPLVLRPGAKAALPVGVEAKPALRVQEETLVVESSVGFSVLRVKVVRPEERGAGGSSGARPPAGESTSPR